MIDKVAYAEEAVQRGGLAVAASNGRDAIVMCLECPPPADNAMAASNSPDGDAADANDAGDANSDDDDDDDDDVDNDGDDSRWQASETVPSLDVHAHSGRKEKERFCSTYI